MSVKRVFAVSALQNDPSAKLGDCVHVSSLVASAPPLKLARDWAKDHNHPWHLMELAEFDEDGELVLRMSAEEWEHELLCGVSR